MAPLIFLQCARSPFAIIQYPGRGESVEANLRQYGLEHRYVDMLVADAASSIWRQKEIFDAIVTDRKHFLPPP